jgi:sugar/nucleoside kinase (ribokinase family)
MTHLHEIRERCAAKLLTSVGYVSHLTAFAGLDGFVDEIIHVVDTRDSATSFRRLPTITKLAERLAGAAGRSTNIEVVTERTKLGGNGPILANALASFGIKVTYLGALGYPTLHPVFNEFARRAEVYSIAHPGQTDALEFEDGKVMLTKTVSLNEITWANIQTRFGRNKFFEKFGAADLVGFVNWTMIPFMSDIWAALLEELAAHPTHQCRIMFFDLADPQKRTKEDIVRALEMVAGFEKHFDVVLGLNEKEAFEIGEVMGLDTSEHSRDGLSSLALQIIRQLLIGTLVIHPVTYALAASRGVVQVVDGPYVAKPLITTGAGDHFNAGFCLGKLCGLDNELSVLTGVTASGFYVRNAQSPSIPDLAEMLRDWPER